MTFLWLLYKTERDVCLKCTCLTFTNVDPKVFCRAREQSYIQYKICLLKRIAMTSSNVFK